MLPAHPPLPTASNLPFQFSVGIHISISMCESDEGARTAATRQCAGSTTGGGAEVPGAWNGPAGTLVAAVIVTFGSESVRRLSHATAGAASAWNANAPINK